MKGKAIKHVNSTLQTRNSLSSIVSGNTYVQKVNLSKNYPNNSNVVIKDLGNGYSEIVSKKK